ncbi:MAG: hypothetical protein WCN95_08415 [bacterium]
MRLFLRGAFSWMIGVCFLIGAHSLAQDAAPSRESDPITAEMREALGRINRIHSGMDQRVIDEAVEALHGEIERHKAEVFVGLAVPHLMCLAPKDTRTRILLRRAMAKHWIDEDSARAWLVLAGDPPQPHIDALIQALERPTPQGRARAMEALRACGAYGKPALPKLRKVIESAKADPRDFDRAYMVTQEVPEHVLAHWAILAIGADSGDQQRK